MTPLPHPSEVGGRFDDAVIDAGVLGLTRAYAARALDPLQAVHRYLARIARWNGVLGAFVDLDSDGARAAAAASSRRWARGRPRSALDGVPVAVKSNIAVAGLPWTDGIGAYRERRATRDAACVARLRKAGVIVLGTTNMDEAALGAIGDNPWFGRTANPYGLERIAGGSSAGSAVVVAAGLCAAALGTDTFGSVRIPAGYCGVFGFKPEFGRIPLAGVERLAKFFDTVGVLARSAEDSLAVIEVAGGVTTRLVSSPSLPTVGLAGFIGAEGAVLEQRLRARIESQGLRAEAIDLEPDPFRQCMKAALLIAEVEGARSLGDVLADPAAEISPTLRRMFTWGSGQSRSALYRARFAVADGRTRLLRQLAAVDLLLTPAVTGGAPLRRDSDDRGAARHTLTASLCGLPAMAVPFGQDALGMPLAIQIVGHDERTVIAWADRLAQMPPAPRLSDA